LSLAPSDIMTFLVLLLRIVQISLKPSDNLVG
jgi:hypothetical protein